MYYHLPNKRIACSRWKFLAKAIWRLIFQCLPFSIQLYHPTLILVLRISPHLNVREVINPISLLLILLESTLRGINAQRTRWKKRFLPWNFCDNILEFWGTHFETVGDAEKIDFSKNNLNTIVWYLVGKKKKFAEKISSKYEFSAKLQLF